MRANPRQSQQILISLFINQQQVGFDVALSVAFPIAAQIVVAISCIERLVVSERHQNRHKITIQGRSMLPF